MEKCKKCKLAAKVLINTIYLILSMVFFEVLSMIPLVSHIWKLDTGTALDIAINIMGTALVITITLLWAIHLKENVKTFKNQPINKMGRSEKELKYCSVFNPFC